MIFISCLTFSLIFINMQIIYFTNLTIGRKACVYALIWYQIMCSLISNTVDTSDFVGFPPILENHITGYHGIHAFAHRQNQFIFEENFVVH